MSYHSSNYSPTQSLENNGFYSKVMSWLALSFGVAAVGVFLIGPLVPPAFILPLSIIVIVALIAASFSRKMMKLSGPFAVIIPLLLGVTLYPTLNYYISSGMGNVVGMAAGGTAVVFGTMAILGWVSKISLNSWAPKLFMIVMGLIAVSLLNVFFFKLAFLSLIISMVVVVVFAIYTFIDIQAIRDRSPNSEVPASFYALNIFLDIYNIFVSLLNIIGFFNRA